MVTSTNGAVEAADPLVENTRFLHGIFAVKRAWNTQQCYHLERHTAPKSTTEEEEEGEEFHPSLDPAPAMTPPLHPLRYP